MEGGGGGGVTGARGAVYIFLAVGALVALIFMTVYESKSASGVSVAVHVAECAAGCGMGPSRGRCVDGTCMCSPGYAGANCTFNSMELLGTENVFEGFPKRPIDEQNWTDPPRTYETMAEEANAQFIIEIGVWKGGSARVWASWLKARNRGVLVCVDTWLGSVENWATVRNPQSALKLENGHPTTYWTFMNNIMHWNLTQYVIPFPTASIHAALYFREMGLKADVVYIDAGHDYDSVVQDVDLWWDVVKPGGVLGGHDWGHGGVKRGVTDAAAKHGVTSIHPISGSWWLRMPAKAKEEAEPKQEGGR